MSEEQLNNLIDAMLRETKMESASSNRGLSIPMLLRMEKYSLQKPEAQYVADRMVNYDLVTVTTHGDRTVYILTRYGFEVASNGGWLAECKRLKKENEEELKSRIIQLDIKKRKEQEQLKKEIEIQDRQRSEDERAKQMLHLTERSTEAAESSARSATESVDVSEASRKVSRNSFYVSIAAVAVSIMALYYGVEQGKSKDREIETLETNFRVLKDRLDLVESKQTIKEPLIDARAGQKIDSSQLAPRKATK